MPTFTTLASFNGFNGADPKAGLIADAAGDLFGTTEMGGANNNGAVFEIAKSSTGYAGTPTILASFNGTDGANPVAGLTADAAGDLFGTTSLGGANNDGVVFEIAKTASGYAGTPTTLVSFNGTNGAEPFAGLIADAAGDLLGTTEMGGANPADGAVFEIAKSSTGYASTPTILASFNGTDGQFPVAGLTADAAGDLFGTTVLGGAHDDGTVFEIAKTGGSYASMPTTLVGFNGANGNEPLAGLIADAAGDLFGTTQGGGADGGGTVFEIAKTGSGYANTPTVLASFNGYNGETPYGALIADAAGDLFGTTSFGVWSAGTVFEIAKTGGSYASTPTVLASFNGTNGAEPFAGLIADAAGDLFGTTFYGGAYGLPGIGTVFELSGTGFVVPNPPPPVGTTADMILRDSNNGNFEIYDIGSNAILAAYPFGQVGPVGLEWQVAGLGGFYGTDTSDMILRNRNTGAFEVYDVSNNNITSAASLGQVGLEWQVSGFGDFSSRAGETDMLMRNSNAGAFEVYDISNNALTSAASMGQVGLEWTVAGFGDFSGNAGESDTLMRNSNTGAFEVYDISHNALTSAAAIGAVGLEWTVAGFGDFSGNANETDMLMRNSNTGAFEVYDISHNALTSAAAMGQVGLEWTVAGFGDLSGKAGESDMLMRNSNTGAFEVYDISHNALTSAAALGQIGLQWRVAGIAADPPAAASAASTARLVQAIAGFSAGGAPLATGAIGATTASEASAPATLLAAHTPV